MRALGNNYVEYARSSIPANIITLEGISIDLMNNIPLVSVALVSMSVLIFSTPVVMLFVFDKNTGVLEYLLSTGLDQLDVFKGYVKASLSLASILLAFSALLNSARDELPHSCSYSKRQECDVTKHGLGSVEIIILAEQRKEDIGDLK
jgi:hypothetical protein